MQIHVERQGSSEWLALRGEYFTASESPAMMGVSPYMTRAELLLMKATGLAPAEVTPQQQDAFNEGHRTEALARVIVEEREDCDFFPVVASEGSLLASVDGVTMDHSTIFEHKLVNAGLVAQIAAGELEPAYYWQLEAQLYVFKAERVLFVASDGTLEHWHELEYKPVPGRLEQLLAGWAQFEVDLASVVASVPKAEVIGRAPDALPALHIELTGGVRASNLAEFKAVAMGVISSIKTDLQTDQDFADAETTIKFLSDVESRLKAAKDHALSQTADVYALLATIDGIINSARDTRLTLDKSVTNCKKSIRENITLAAAKALTAHIDAINETLGGKVKLPMMRGNFADAIKGKRTLDTLSAAADSELARMKAEANTVAQLMRTNLASLRELAKEHAFLFHDAQSLVLKDNEAVVAIIENRIIAHNAELAAKQTVQEQVPAPGPAVKEQAPPLPIELPPVNGMPSVTVVIRGLHALPIGAEVRGGRVVFVTPGDWSLAVQSAMNKELQF